MYQSNLMNMKISEVKHTEVRQEDRKRKGVTENSGMRPVIVPGETKSPRIVERR